MSRCSVAACLLIVLTGGIAAAQEPGTDADPQEGKGRAFLSLDPGHHVGPIQALLFTPDGKQLISAGEDKTIQVWDVATGERLKVFRPPVGGVRQGAIVTAALAPDGKTLMAGGPVVSDADGKFVHSVYLLNLEDGRILPVPGVDRWAPAVAFSPDGEQLAVLQHPVPYSREWGQPGKLRLFRGLKDVWARGAKVPRPWTTINVGKNSPGLAFSPDGSLLALSTLLNKTIRIWDISGSSAEPVAELKMGHQGPTGLAWSSDGRRLVSVHHLTDPFHKDPETPAPTGPGVRVWSRDGKSLRDFTREQLVAAGVWPKMGDPERVIDAVRFVGKDEVVLCSNGAASRSVALLDLGTSRARVVTELPPYTHKARTALAMTADRRLVAVSAAPEGHRIALFEPKEGAKVRFLQKEAATNDRVGWRGIGYTLAWGTRADKSPSAGLDLKTAEFVKRPPDDVLSAVTKRDGWKLERVDAVGDFHVRLVKGDGEVRAPRSPDPVESFTLPAEGKVGWFAFTHDAGLKLADAKSGDVLRHFVPAGRLFRSVTSSPDGKYIAVYSTQERYYVYDPKRARPLLSVFASGPEWIAWTEEGYYAASPNADKIMGWTVNNGFDRLATFYPAERFSKVLYRPDVIRRVLEKGSVTEAVKAANAARAALKIAVPKALADSEKLLPPGVSLSVVNDKALPRITVKVAARAAVREQPIKSLRLMVDGRRLLAGKAVATFAAGEEKEEYETTWDADLPPGRHKLSVLALSKDDTYSFSESITVNCPLPPGQRPALHHLAVGINDYDRAALTLKAAATDARRLAAAFAASCAGGSLYRLAKDNPGPLLDKAATREAVLRAIENIRKTAKPNDLLIVSFAGHGVCEEGEFFLLTKEADPTSAATLAKTAISGAELRQKLADVPCQVLLLFDACQSGAFGAGALRGYRPASDEAARALADVEARVAVMCAALSHEEAIERDGHGLFSAAIERALKKDPNAYFDPQTGELNVYDLQAYVYREVARASDNRQTPYLKMPQAQPPFVVTQFPK